MTKLWLIDYTTTFHPINGKLVVMQCDHEPTECEAESAVHEAYYTGGTVYIDSITETSESKMRGKEYYLAGAKQ